MLALRRFAAAAALASGILWPALSPAQQQGSPAAADSSAVATPFPTKLRVGSKGGNILLTWLDAPTASAGYAVFRDLKPISAASIAGAQRIATVPPAVQTYTDAPPEAREYFYLVLALSDSGAVQSVFAPGKNASQVGVSVETTVPAASGSIAAAAGAAAPPSVPGPAPSAGAAPKAGAATAPSSPSQAAAASSAAKPAAGPAGTSPAASAAAAPPGPSTVDALAAQPRGDAILLSYHAAPGTRLVLYRGTEPLREASDLLDATLVAAFKDKDGTFADYPVPGVGYWYALVGEDDLKQGRISLAAGKSATAQAVSVSSRPGSAGAPGIVEVPPTSRTPPLPGFLLDAGLGTSGESFQQEDSPPSARVLSPESEKAVAALLAFAPAITPPMPKLSILPEELSSPTGGEDYSLAIIVSNRLASKDWAGAADQLRKYLSLNRSAAAVARARFYLGQALAFSGSYRESFFEFLLARSTYTAETRPWIEFILFAMREDV